MNEANILLCQILNHHFEYIYREGKETIKFASPYLLKVIDYSHSYIIEESDRIFDLICNEKKCDPDCGEMHGYKFAYISKEYAMDDELMDLALLYFIEKNKDALPLDPDFQKVIVSLEYRRL